jgi:1,4-dihydroxy-2-naphthoate octaprenyltransferase
MDSIPAWLAAARPKTLSLSLIPVMVGTALAYAETGQVVWLPACGAMLAAILIQIGTNLHNDVIDFESGTDTSNRLGPLRATAQGWIDPAAVRHASMFCFGFAFVLGIYLVVVGGWPILVLGLASLAAGGAYSAGPFPISGSPFGEFFVFLFFGLAAVGGSYYLQTLGLNQDVLLAGSALGLLAAAVLVVNNYRDSKTDASSGRLTLAVLIGPAGSKMEYLLLILIPFGLLQSMHLAEMKGYSFLLPWLTLPWALYLIYRIYHLPKDKQLNSLLAQTAQLQVGFGGLLVLAAVL